MKVGNSLKAGEPWRATVLSVVAQSLCQWFLSLAQGSSLWSSSLQSEAGKNLNMTNLNSVHHSGIMNMGIS